MLKPEQTIANFEFYHLDPTIHAFDMLTNTQYALTQLKTNRINNVEDVHQDITFTDSDITDLVEFLKTLTDSCVKDRACLAPWIPNAGDNDPDGLSINAFNNTGTFFSK